MIKYFVFSDIHGNLKPLVTALEKKGFDLENDNHILLSLGDHFDRGIENLRVLGFLKYFERIGRLIMIRGNHDDFLLNFLKGIDNGIFNVRNNGMGNTLIEFATKDANTIPKIRESINSNYPFLVPMLENMKDKFILGNTEFTHAGYQYDHHKGWYIYNFSNAFKFVRDFDTKNKLYVFGHQHVQELNEYFNNIISDEPFRYNNFIGIDAKTIITKKVNVLVFNEKGIEV